MRKAGAGADEGRPSGSQEETAGGLSSSQPRQEPSEGDNKKQTPTFRFPQGNWSTREQYYAQVFVVSGYMSLPGSRSGTWDPEAGAWQPIYVPMFEDRRTRKGFVEKVMGLVLQQLLVTVGACALFRYWEPLLVAVQDNAWVFFLLWAISFVAVLALANSPRVRRTHPYNVMTWIIFTLSFALIVGTITSLFRTELLLMALGLTAAAVAFIFLVAAATDFDFTQAGSLLYILAFVFLIMIIIGVFTPSNVYYLVISAVAAVLFSSYLLYDLQAIMGGRTVELSPDDYVYAAVQVYLDVVVLFVSLLNILALAQGAE
ncbi:g11160 [Coccomyxa elongata]